MVTPQFLIVIGNNIPIYRILHQDASIRETILTAICTHLQNRRFFVI